MRKIPLRNRTGKIVRFTTVDDEDFERFGHITFHLGSGYAKTAKWNGKTKKAKTFFLHRMILGLKKGEMCDHVNRNRLDNRRANLRKCDYAQNAWNMKRFSTKPKFPKGVHMGDAGYRASITVRSVKHDLGTFKTIKSAKQAYDKAAREYFGEFARTK